MILELGYFYVSQFFLSLIIFSCQNSEKFDRKVIFCYPLSSSWVLYLQHANNKFQAILPNAPLPTSDTDTQDLHQAEIAPDILGQKENAELPTLHTDTKAETKSVSPVETYTQKLYEGMTSELIEIPIELTAEANGNVESPKPRLKPISEMPLEEIEAEVQRRRQTLI